MPTLTETKMLDSSVTLVSPTLSRHELSRILYQSHDSRELVSRAFGYVYRCAEINANGVASTPLLLFRKPSPRTRKRLSQVGMRTLIKRVRLGLEPREALNEIWPTRPISKARRRWLEEGSHRGMLGPSIGVRAKAASMTGDLEQVIAHPLIDTLLNANINENGYDLIWLAQMFQELTGKAYWGMAGDEVPTTLHTLMPQFMDPVTSDGANERLIVGYRYGADETSKVYIAAEDVVPFRQPSPIDPLDGMGPLGAGIQFAEVARGVADAMHSVYKRGGFIEFAMIAPERSKWTPDQKKDIQTAFGKFRGVRQWMRKVLLLDNGVKIERISEKPTDAAFEEADIAAMRRVSVMFGVPMSMLTNEGGNRLGQTTNSEQGADDYIINTRQPRLVRNEQALNTFLVPNYGDESLMLVYEAPLTEDENVKSGRVTQQYQAGVRTRNEAREELNLEAVEGGDEFFTPGGGDPFAGLGLLTGAAGDEEEAPEPVERPSLGPEDRQFVRDTLAMMQAGEVTRRQAVALFVASGLSRETAEELVGPEEEVEPEPEPVEEAPDPVVVVEDAAGEPEDAEKAVDGCCGGGDCEALSYAEACWKAAGGFEGDDERFVSKVAPLAPRQKQQDDSPFRDRTDFGFIARMARFLRLQGESIVQQVRAGELGESPRAFNIDKVPYHPAAKAIEGKALEGAWIAALTSMIDDATRDVVLEGLLDGVTRLGQAAERSPVGFSFNLTSDFTDQVFDRRGGLLLRHSRDINETTQEAVRAVFKQGRAAKLSRDEVADLLEQHFEQVTPSRALMIARTETANAHSEALREVYKEAGAEMEWMVAPNACEFCRVFSDPKRGRKAIDTPFVRGGTTLRGVEGGTMKVARDVFAPPLHPNDRCSLFPVVD